MKLSPLRPLESILYPLLARLKKPSEREILARRRTLTKKRNEQRKAQSDLAKLLKKEARHYETLIVNCWVRLGEAWITAAADLSNEGRSPSRAKIKKVKFSRIFTTPEQIFFQIEINKRRVAGSKNVLPHRVFVANLTSEASMFELSHACNRRVETRIEDPRKGAWIVVNRLEGFDGIPLYVAFKDLLSHFPSDMGRGPILLGIGENRKVHMVDLALHPHVLIAGSTQGGKSNMINQIITGLMRFTDPSEVGFILIDLKRLEFPYYKDAPHLLQPVIFEPEAAIETLSSLLAEIKRRTEMLEGKAKELSEWNKKYPKEKLSRIIVVIDEFAELMLASGKEVASTIARLITRMTNLGRAVGIHVIAGTQRPDVKVLPGSIKINMPLIISARVPNYSQSVVILGSRAAADLPVDLPGRMIYQSGSNLNIVQTPFISQEDIEEAVSIARGRKAGIIRLEGIDPFINDEGMILYIADCLQGDLTPGRVWEAVKEMGVPPRDLKAWLKTLFSAEEVIEAGGRVFRMVKGEEWYHLVEEFHRYERQSATSGDLRRIIATLKAPPAILALPAPTIEPVGSDEPTPQPASMPPLPIHPLRMTEKEIIDLFIERCCVKGNRYSEMSAKLYRAYLIFCNELDPEIRTVHAKAFGRFLSPRGFERSRNAQSSFWKGLKLNSVYTERIVQNHPDAA